MSDQRTWPEKLREAAQWFDLVDKLLAVITIEDNATGDVAKLTDRIGAGREIQDDLLTLATAIEDHEADRENGYCAAPIEFYAQSVTAESGEHPDAQQRDLGALDVTPAATQRDETEQHAPP